ncbi:MAG: hypothetical protein ACE5DL_02505 [Nitrosopumilaceae archaeon]
MSHDIEGKYDQFLEELANTVGPLDPNFAMRLMYLERKMLKSMQPSILPHVALTIQFKTGVNRDNKIENLRTTHGLWAENLDKANEILATGYMDMNKVLEISTDSDIETISGKASPVIRG